MLDSPEFGSLADQIMLHEGCFKKNPVVFEQVQNDFGPSRGKVTECVIYKFGLVQNFTLKW